MQMVEAHHLLSELSYPGTGLVMRMRYTLVWQAYAGNKTSKYKRGDNRVQLKIRGRKK